MHKNARGKRQSSSAKTKLWNIGHLYETGALEGDDHGDDFYHGGLWESRGRAGKGKSMAAGGTVSPETLNQCVILCRA